MPTQNQQPPAWREVLEQIDQGLQQFLAAVPQLALASCTPGPAAPAAIAPGPLDDRFARLPPRLEQTEEEASRMQAELTADIEALERWLCETAAARLRLAEMLRALPMVAAASPTA